ncbi:MAG: hypothetical protein Q7S75_03865 [bacterium]|nr:hypothetical protein [bacterium]
MRWVGNEQGLFVQNLWYDKIMHTFGGFVTCALVFCGLANCHIGIKWAILRFGLPIAGVEFALFGGSIWEWLEWYYPIMTEYIPQSRLDTTFDIVFDCLGGYIAGHVYNKKWRWQ